MDGSDDRRARERAVTSVVEKSKNDLLDAVLDKVAGALHENFSHYTGVYIYLLQGETLVLGPFRGRPTEHTRIPVGAGICGRAARVKQTITIDDVQADAEYIACSLETKSEIVVPILKGDRVVGEIDIDSDDAAAFSSQDRVFLEEIANLIAQKFSKFT
ncbi:MAG TPA: GAF domain-containing protein [Anaerolineae bacterium]